MNRRTLIVSPGYGHFHDFELVAKSDVDDLRVEAPAIDALARENLGGGAAGKRLESALGVAERKTHQHPDEQVKGTREDAAAERLTHELQRRVEPARADGHVRALFERAEQLGGFGY